MLQKLTADVFGIRRRNRLCEFLAIHPVDAHRVFPDTQRKMRPIAAVTRNSAATIPASWWAVSSCAHEIRVLWLAFRVRKIPDECRRLKQAMTLHAEIKHRPTQRK